MLTGEPMPVEGAGDRLTAGTINQTGGVAHAAGQVGRDNALAQIVRMAGEAQRAGAGIQRLADRIAAYRSAVALVAVGAFVGAAWGPGPAGASRSWHAVAVLDHRAPARSPRRRGSWWAPGRARSWVSREERPSARSASPCGHPLVDKTGARDRGRAGAHGDRHA
jgi:hypothetical protein